MTAMITTAPSSTSAQTARTTPALRTVEGIHKARGKRGIGWHADRGFETVTLAWEGSVAHRDNAGNAGIIGPGDVQWMTARRRHLSRGVPRGRLLPALRAHAHSRGLASSCSSLTTRRRS
jgi:hypothetical protein